ncbi:hypothetical protein [Microbacterium sp. SORGH_AS_0862]|uniref:hypothetical protein n=1 Tax=Microbacterium sp. SORGH_AS_0862 TaxID=3041789 RepID=UPI002794CD7D|nr:hypothetical protein [Microbacterium sp. SORGH_AS_0862]MDQ1205018.1 hypothetical protein [Microbacterium sp. SORGH_AS_0862]
MLAGLVQPRETQTVEVTGHTLEDVHQQLVAKTPPGFVLAAGPVRMAKGTTELSATGTYAATAVEEIEADDMAALEAKVPDGWRLLSVRRL